MNDVQRAGKHVNNELKRCDACYGRNVRKRKSRKWILHTREIQIVCGQRSDYGSVNLKLKGLSKYEATSIYLR